VKECGAYPAMRFDGNSNSVPISTCPQQMPFALKRAWDRSRNTYVATEATNGNRTLLVVRGMLSNGGKIASAAANSRRDRFRGQRRTACLS
jgi:hypothetical protein